MASPDHESLEARLLGLPAKDRARLAELLLGSLEPADPGAAAAWDEEIRTRMAELENGTVRGIPASEVFAEIERHLRR